jgi:membrane protein implicated in regulation of membrane protease activity
METIFEAWHIWALICIGLFILEMFVPGFVLGCLAIGALGGMVMSWFTDTIELQLIAAAVLTVVSFLFIRPFALTRLNRKIELKTNIDSLIGRKAKVSHAFDHSLLKGRVAVDGDDWMAYTETPQELQIGDIVEILRVESNSLIVRSLNN